MKIVVDFINQAQRVMKVAKKPDYAEFERMFKIVLFATIVIGLLGFIISAIFALFA